MLSKLLSLFRTETGPNGFVVKFSQECYGNLNKICGQTGIKTPVDVIRRALALFHLASNAVRDGGKVIIQDKDGNNSVIDISVDPE